MKIDETIQQFYRRIRVADVEGFGSLFAPDAVNHDPVGAPPYLGPEGARTFLIGVLDLTDRFDIAMTQVIRRGNRKQRAQPAQLNWLCGSSRVL